MTEPRNRELESLRRFLQEADLGKYEREESHILLERAAKGDELAMLQAQVLATARGYEPPPGEGEPVPPGQKMVCPEDPDHYSTYRQSKDEVLYCPEHHCELVPADEV